MTREEMSRTALGRYLAQMTYYPVRSSTVVDAYELWDSSGRRYKALVMWGGGVVVHRDDCGDPGDEA